MRTPIACLGILLLGCLALAQASGQPAPAKKAPAEPTVKKAQPAPVPPKEEPRDPTQPSPKLKEALEPARTGPGQATAPRLPAITLKGRVIAPDKAPAALIEVEGKAPPYLVTKGTTVMVGNVQLRIVEVNAVEVRIEVHPLNETLLLR